MTPSSERPLRILAVDDDDDVLELYRQALCGGPDNDGSGRVKGEHLDLFNQGGDAIDAVRRSLSTGRPYAVAFLDLNLSPGIDGLATGERIRELDDHINVVIVTGMVGIDPRDITSRIPPEDKILYIQKPFHIQEVRQFASALGAKWHSEMLLRRTNRELEERVAELRQNRRELLHHRNELESVNTQLLETNNALTVLARNLEKTRKESELRVYQRIRTLILPIIDNLRRDSRLSKIKPDLDLLVNYIGNLTDELPEDTRLASSLSATEMRIASMIKNGMSSEDVAEHLCISLSTVKTHRKNIRRKLNLRNSKKNLRAYLLAQSGI